MRGSAKVAFIEAMLTIAPLALASSVRNAMQVRNVPVRFTSSTRMKVSISYSLSRARMPAQLISASTRSWRPANDFTASSSVMSSGASCRPGRGFNCVRAMSSALTPVALTVAPRSQNRLAIAAPISPAPPITTAWNPAVSEKGGFILLSVLFRRRGRFPDDQRMIDLVVHDGLLACEMTDQIFAGPLPDRRDRHLDRREARPQVPAPVEVVEADHRQLPRHREAAAFGFQQDAIGDDVVAADHGGRAVFQVQQIARGLAGIVQRIGHLDMPLRALLDVVLGKCPPEARDAGAGAVVVALKRGHDADPPVTEFDEVQRRAMGGALIVGADTGVGAIRLVDPDIDKRHRIVRKQLAQRVVMAIAAQHQAVDAASDQAARLLQFGVEIVTAGGHEQHVADRREIFLQRRDAAR